MVVQFLSNYSGMLFPSVNVSNIILTNALPVEFNSDPAFSNKNKTKIQENQQGVRFKDIFNTVKEVKIKLPLLSLESYLYLDTHFFSKIKDISFAIIPLNQSGTIYNEDYENKRFTGFYELKEDILVERQVHNVYNIELSLKEVI
jgi:hypothetical protein